MDNILQLKDGSEWPEHEDCIIGNEQVLRSLIVACEVAIEKGEYYGSDLGGYVGVKRIDSSWFKNPTLSSRGRFTNFTLLTIVSGVIVLTFTGLFTVLNWVF